MRRAGKRVKAKGGAKRPVAGKSRANEGSGVGDLEQRLAEALKREAEALEQQKATAELLQTRNRELAEAQEQQAATSEILQVIATSPTDVQPVFAAVLRSAARLCDAFDATIFQVDGDGLRLVAHEGPILSHPVGEFPLIRGITAGRAVLDRRTIHVPDLQAEVDEYPDSSFFARSFGVRTTLSVPLRRGTEAIGAIAIRRTEVRPFTDRQIELLQTFAAQAVIAIENVRLFNETKEALEQQTATSEILQVISSSPTDLQPVLEAVVENAARVCGATDSGIWLLEGEHLRPVARRGSLRRPVAIGEPIPVNGGFVSGRVVCDRRTIHVEDMLAAESEFPAAVSRIRQTGATVRTMLGTPLLREGTPLGVIFVSRGPEVHPFSATQIALLETFAAQAVIAIENVRLFTELEGKNLALTKAHAQVTEALDQQTATGEILRVISSSPTDLAPVMDAVTRNAIRLAQADHALIGEAVEGRIRWLAASGCPLVSDGPHISHELPSGRAILDCQTTQVEDVTELTEHFPGIRRAYDEFQVRTILATPLVREGLAIGVLLVRRTTVRSFTGKEIELLKTFADQAVIAIENVRLFTELQARNRELTESLEQRTATGEILGVIASSPSDVQPVFDTIARNAVRLCDAVYCAVFQVKGNRIDLVAHYNIPPEGVKELRTVYPAPLDANTRAATTARERVVRQISDVESDPAVGEFGRRLARMVGYRSQAFVPMLRGDQTLGVITLSRGEAGPFPPQHIALLRSFANQAVIAIENVRLFQELRARTAELTRSVEQLTALGEVGRAVSSTLNLDTVLDTIVTRANQLAGTDGCSILEYDEAAELFRLRASRYADPREAAVLDPIARATPIPKGQGVAGRAALHREAVHIPDIAVEGAYESPVRVPLLQAGYRALLGVPLLREEQVIGVLTVIRKTPGDFAPEVVRVLTTFAVQSALAIQNARLFREIENKSRQLEAASHHKSEFLANMSHELRTPLNAILGFSEVLAERMFGEVNDKQAEYLQDILSSGRHLLSLINDILDLSKVEAGRLELELSEFHLPTALDNALTLVRERATRHGIRLTQTVDERLGDIVADERKVKQILLNLLSNAVKFTPEGGRVRVTAALVEEVLTIEISDTGIGIAPEDQAAIFEEFRQVGREDARKQEGTGLGLTLAKKFVELHGGRIWVRSQVGLGSTFSFTLSARPGERGARDQGGGDPPRL